MHLKVEELKLVLKWFDLSEEGLEDVDLKLYDKIKDYMSDEADEDEESEDSDDFVYGNREESDFDDEDNYGWQIDEDDSEY